MTRIRTILRFTLLASMIIISACVSKESIVIPPAKPIEHPQLERLSSQTIENENGTFKFGENKKYLITGIKTVSLKGSPYEIGYAHGKLLDEEITEYLKYYIHTIKSYALGTDIGVNLMMKRAKIVEKNFPAEYLEELHGISSGANIDYDLLLFYNTLPTIAKSFSGYGCSSFAFKRKNSSVIHSRGFDFPIPKSLSRRVLFIYKPTSGYGFFCIERPGMISAWTGMNENGITFGLHDLYGISQKTWDTTPYTVQRRLILQYSDSIDDVEKIVRQQSVYPIGLYLVASNKGASVFELANDKMARIDMDDYYIALSNHSRRLTSMRYESTLERLDYLHSYLEKNLESMNIEKAIKLNRAPTISRPKTKFMNTHSVIFRPNDLNFWVAMSQEHQKEPACFGTYTGFNLSKLLYGQGQAPNPAHFPEKKN